MAPHAIDDLEAYELQSTNPESDSASSPLLPAYSSSAPGPSSPPLTLGGRKGSVHRPKKRSNRGCRTLLIVWSLVVPALLGGALIGCYTGQSGRILEGLKDWEAVPQDVKDWMDKVVPGPGAPGRNEGMFPTNVGYAGPTPTGNEPALLLNSPHAPLHTGISPLIPPSGSNHKSKPIHHLWGNLSPYHSVNHGLGDTSALIPAGCELTELHWLQRHGARYPTSTEGGPSEFAGKLRAMRGWKASGELKFLEGWEWQLGAEVLTPFGREQLFDLGVSARVKYGFLLDKMKGRLPVFRTESQDRMLKSAQNFAAGFFGIPAEDQYNLEVMIESPGFNNTLAPWNTCDRSGYNYTAVRAKLETWDNIYLKNAHKRIQKNLRGLELSIQDVRRMMDICPYESVALGYSEFCGLFTEKEWKGYEYRWDLFWWYSSSFGYPRARAQGRGWTQELLSRLTHTRMTEFNSSTNSSFHNDIQFPLFDALYVDFTHDSHFALLLPTLNLTTFAEAGPLPADHIPKHRTFVSSELVPFATNMQVQVLSCGARGADDVTQEGEDGQESEDDKGQKEEVAEEAQEIAEDKEEATEENEEAAEEAKEETEDTAIGTGRRLGVRTPTKRQNGRGPELKVRIILNDGVVPLTGIRGCGEDEDGLCALDAFVESLTELMRDGDPEGVCGQL